MRIAFSIALLLLLSACASAPERIYNACAIFEQRDGLFNNWSREARKVEQEFGVPVPILMATIYTESGFRANARPPRTKLLGFIPWKRVSSAYGYSQALDATWAQYQQETGNRMAKRNSFSDAIDFVGWYHSKTSDRFGVARSDAYNLYLAYYFGWTGYGRGDWQSKPGLQRYARQAEKMARDYDSQLQQCS